ncbi:hypothetical protein [Actinophytocola sp.]|uniref:hypothetical protein n=1 Tax=Actinophytocola sp. TaxID=1872138 RepID=UPI002D7F7ED2|nr:hypothetical protein [Actinophytocola sp.]HET9140967.1 hypothetical protein [Actinophytocola sp.]HEU5108873.1 hypothetical protein [Micromonosporaceae bacterium]
MEENRVVSLIAGAALLLVVGGMVAIPAGFVVELKAIDCRAPDEAIICDPQTRRLVALVPMLALGAGLVLLAAGGAVAVRRGGSSAPWQFAAWLLLAAGVLVAFAIALA